MTVSFEAVPHSPSCGVAQPQSSMKESHPAKLHLQEVAPTGTASSTSNKSTSLQLLLLLHVTVGDAALRRRNEGPCSSRSHTATRAAGRRLNCARVTAVLVSWWSPPAPAARRASGAFASSETYHRTYRSRPNALRVAFAQDHAHPHPHPHAHTCAEMQMQMQMQMRCA